MRGMRRWSIWSTISFSASLFHTMTGSAMPSSAAVASSLTVNMIPPSPSDGDHRAVRRADLGADRQGQGNAQGTIGAGIEPAALDVPWAWRRSPNTRSARRRPSRWHPREGLNAKYSIPARAAFRRRSWPRQWPRGRSAPGSAPATAATPGLRPARADDRASIGGTGVGLNGHGGGVHGCQFGGIDVDPDDVARNIELGARNCRPCRLPCPPAIPRRRRQAPPGWACGRWRRPGTRDGIPQVSLAGIGGKNRAPICSAMAVSARPVPTAPPADQNQRAPSPGQAIRRLLDGGRIRHGQEGARRVFHSASTGTGSTSRGSDR